AMAFQTVASVSQAPPAGRPHPFSEGVAVGIRDEHRKRAGWAPFLEVGKRVVLRYAIDRETSPHGESMTDALGTILATDDQGVTVMTKRGQVRVPRVLVIAAKEGPPAPVRRAASDAPCSRSRPRCARASPRRPTARSA